MASNTQRTEKVRHRKEKPNKVNMKTQQKRVDKNLEILKRVAAPTQQ